MFCHYWCLSIKYEKSILLIQGASTSVLVADLLRCDSHCHLELWPSPNSGCVGRNLTETSWCLKFLAQTKEILLCAMTHSSFCTSGYLHFILSFAYHGHLGLSGFVYIRLLLAFLQAFVLTVIILSGKEVRHSEGNWVFEVQQSPTSLPQFVVNCLILNHPWIERYRAARGRLVMSGRYCTVQLLPKDGHQMEVCVG